MALPAQSITVALDMSKAFDTINIHTLIRKLLQTNIPGTIIKFFANYFKGHTANTTYRNQTFSQRQFKAGVPQGGVLSPTLLNIYTTDIPPLRAPIHVMAYADDITITSTHTIMSAAKKYLQPYLHTVFAWAKQNNLTLNPDKTTCTLSLQTLHNTKAIWTKPSYFSNMSTYTSTRHNTNRKHNIHHIPYTNIQHTSTLQGF